MNRHLLRNWRRRVGTGDTVICLGDVARPDGWRDDRFVLDLAEGTPDTLPIPKTFPTSSPSSVTSIRSKAGASRS